MESSSCPIALDSLGKCKKLKEVDIAIIGTSGNIELNLDPLMGLDQLKILNLYIPAAAAATIPQVNEISLECTKPNHSIENLSIVNSQYNLFNTSFKNINLLKNLQKLRTLEITGIGIDTLEEISPIMKKSVFRFGITSIF